MSAMIWLSSLRSGSPPPRMTEIDPISIAQNLPGKQQAKQTKAAAAGEEFAKAAVLPRTGIAEEGGEDARGAFGV